MNRMHLYLASVWLVGGFIPCGAQTDEANTPPSPPYVATVSVPSMWRIKFSSKLSSPITGGTAATQRYIKESQVKKTTSKKQVVNLWSDGGEAEIWHVNGLILYHQPQFTTGDVAIYPPGSSGGLDYLMTDFSESDFPTLSWIDDEAYKRRESYNGQQCFYFESDPKVILQKANETARGGMRDTAVPAMKAWIAVDTKLPVAVEIGGTIQEYTFSKDAPKTLTLPPLFEKKLDDYLAKKAAVIRLPPPN
jgi:hypothetical protein